MTPTKDELAAEIQKVKDKLNDFCDQLRALPPEGQRGSWYMVEYYNTMLRELGYANARLGFIEKLQGRQRIKGEVKIMAQEKLTLGQGVDAMLDGKIIQIGNGRLTRWNAKFRSFECKGLKDPAWNSTVIDFHDVHDAAEWCRIYELPIKWKKATWLETLNAVYGDKKAKAVREEGVEQELTKKFLDGFFISSLRDYESQFYIEDTSDAPSPA